MKLQQNISEFCEKYVYQSIGDIKNSKETLPIKKCSMPIMVKMPR
jgi:hypothetical protein